MKSDHPFKRIRTSFGQSQYEMARYLGMSRGWIGNIETLICSVGPDLCEKVTEAYQLDVHYMMLYQECRDLYRSEDNKNSRYPNRQTIPSKNNTDPTE